MEIYLQSAILGVGYIQVKQDVKVPETKIDGLLLCYGDCHMTSLF